VKSTYSEKIDKRLKELLTRTSLIFGISEEEAGALFTPKKSSLVAIKPKVVNTLAKDRLSKIAWANQAYVIEGEKALFTHSEEFLTGQIYIQNASSLLPVIALAPKPDEIILDMCAAPGGKTIHIACLTGNKAKIYANDENTGRVENMKKLCELYDAKVYNYSSFPAQHLGRYLPTEYFDKVLLDAPCSGEGMINLSKPDTLRFWSPKKIKRLSRLQKMMIAEGLKLLKPGGTLVYSTCTLAPEENEEVIYWALKNFSGLELVNPEVKPKVANATDGITQWKGKKLHDSCSRCLRVKPNEYMEAFFVGVVKKA